MWQRAVSSTWLLSPRQGHLLPNTLPGPPVCIPSHLEVSSSVSSASMTPPTHISWKAICAATWKHLEN